MGGPELTRAPKSADFLITDWSISASTYSTAIPDPLGTIEAAFNQLKQSVNSNDAHIFQSATLNDVYKAAEEIEQDQR